MVAELVPSLLMLVAEEFIETAAAVEGVMVVFVPVVVETPLPPQLANRAVMAASIKAVKVLV
jgi:hypothetical protein